MSDTPKPLGLDDTQPSSNPVGLDGSPADLDKTLRSAPGRSTRLARGTLVGRYLLLDQIGEGGMATIYSAYDAELDRKVAIKLMKLDPGGGSLESARARLLREAQAAARLSHPNVVSVYDAGAFGDELFMAMELVVGETLRSWLARPGRSLKEILAVFLAAGEGLAAAHAAGLVHRDFKPENVLIGSDGRARVSDFGLARIESRQGPLVPDAAASLQPLEATAVGAVLGTPAYMAPEQFEGRATDPRTDQFAFCVALWEALFGARPFAGDDFWSIRQNVLAGKICAPKREASVPAWLRRVLERGLSSRIEDRFPSFDELLAALRRDRRRRILRTVRRVAMVGLAFAAIGLAVFGYHRESTRCEREAVALVEPIWTPASRRAIERSLGTDGKQLGPMAARALETYFDEWRASWKQACEARQESERAGSSRALGCLERYLQRARAAVHLLGQPSEEAAKDAIATPLLDGLFSPTTCLEASRPVAPSPSGFIAEIEMARALGDTGRRRESLAARRQLLEQAKERGDKAALAELNLLIGRAFTFLGGAGEEPVAHLR
ncbi:MAG: serine/threonine-protein kinase, partial [Myxococcales bacterium]